MIGKTSSPLISSKVLSSYISLGFLEYIGEFSFSSCLLFELEDPLVSFLFSSISFDWDFSTFLSFFNF